MGQVGVCEEQPGARPRSGCAQRPPRRLGRAVAARSVTAHLPPVPSSQFGSPATFQPRVDTSYGSVAATPSFLPKSDFSQVGDSSPSRPGPWALLPPGAAPWTAAGHRLLLRHGEARGLSLRLGLPSDVRVEVVSPSVQPGRRSCAGRRAVPLPVTGAQRPRAVRGWAGPSGRPVRAPQAQRLALWRCSVRGKGPQAARPLRQSETHTTVSVRRRTGRPLRAWHAPAHPPPWGHGSAQPRGLTPGVFSRRSPKAKPRKTNPGKGAAVPCVGTLGSPRPSARTAPPSGGTNPRPIGE